MWIHTVMRNTKMHFCCKCLETENQQCHVNAPSLCEHEKHKNWKKHFLPPAYQQGVETCTHTRSSVIESECDHSEPTQIPTPQTRSWQPNNNRTSGRRSRVAGRLKMLPLLFEKNKKTKNRRENKHTLTGGMDSPLTALSSPTCERRPRKEWWINER